MLLEDQSRFDSGALPGALLQAGDLLDAGVLTTDTDLVVRGWNRWLVAATGWPADEVIGRPLLDLFPELAGAAGERAFRRALGGETVVLAHHFHRFLLPIPASPGLAEFEQMQQSARVAPLVAGGEVSGTIALIQDVTERVAREAQLRTAMEEAQAGNKAKSEFIATMSHELRTPLSAIIGYADLVGNEVLGPLLERQKDSMDRLKAGAWHLLGIIEQILSFSRADAGKEEVHLERLSSLDLAREALSLVEPQAAEKGLSVRLAIAEPPAEIESDRGKLRQILVNLLGNAVKFTDRGEVELRLAGDGGSVSFQVRDTGPGIPPDHLERIFEPFTQVDQSVTRAKGGTGLGLAVSRRMAKLLGGDLEVESTPGVGSVFTLRIPETALAPAEQG